MGLSKVFVVASLFLASGAATDTADQAEDEVDEVHTGPSLLLPGEEEELMQLITQNVEDEIELEEVPTDVPPEHVRDQLAQLHAVKHGLIMQQQSSTKDSPDDMAMAQQFERLGFETRLTADVEGDDLEDDDVPEQVATDPTNPEHEKEILDKAGEAAEEKMTEEQQQANDEEEKKHAHDLLPPTSATR